MSMQCTPNITTLKKYLDLITIITMWIESELIIDLQITPTPYNISCSNAKVLGPIVKVSLIIK